MIPAVALESYRHATRQAGLLPRDDRGWIVVTGKDRASYLHGLFTNDIVALAAGRGCYSAYLTAQGRMIADLWIYELGDLILLSMSLDVKDTLLAKLDQFIFTEDVQLGDVTTTFGGTAVVGPEAASIVAGVVGLDRQMLDEWSEHGNQRATFNGQPAIVLRSGDLGLSGYDIVVDAAYVDALRDALRASGAADLEPLAAEALRVEAGIPKFHRDMDEETIPLEAGIESRAISLTKGCYVGQEVIIRVLHRGHGRVARKLVGLMVAGDEPPEVGAKARAADREIGEVTSSVWSPRLGRPVALAYLHRDFLEPGTAVSVGEHAATVHRLPF